MVTRPDPNRSSLKRSERLVPRLRCLVALSLIVAFTSVHPSLGQSKHERTEKPGERAWPMFRGGPRLAGVAHTRLPDRPKVLWKFEAPDAVTSSAAIVADAVYVGCEDGTLFSLDLATGAVRWKYHVEESAFRASPTVVDGDVFIGDDLGVMHAVDARTGKGKWTFETQDQIISAVNHHGDRLVFGSYDGLVYCLARRTGKLLWKFETGGRVHGTPGIIEDRVVAAGCDEFVHVISLDSGSSVTKVSMGSVSGASAALRGDHVYVGTYGGSVLGIDWRAGRVRWKFDDPERDFPFLASVAVTDRLVIVGGRDKRLRGLDIQTGAEKWSLVTKGRIDSSPVVVDNRVFVGSSDGVLYGVDLATGTDVWRFEAGGPISASPAVAGKVLIVGTEDGVVFCLGER